MASSEKKKKLKSLFWKIAHPKQITNIYSTSLQCILNELWTKFPESLKSEKNEYYDFAHYETLIYCFNQDINKEETDYKELVDEFILVALTEPYEQEKIEKDMINILTSGGKGLNKKITNNRQRGKRRARINSVYKFYITFSKSEKKMTDKQEYASCIFTDQIRYYFLNKFEK